MVRCLREKFVDRTLKSFFYWLGCKIGESPGYFLVVPLLLTALCMSGFQQMDYEFEPEYLGWIFPPIWSVDSAILCVHYIAWGQTQYAPSHARARCMK